jgi:hypothetical protein
MENIRNSPMDRPQIFETHMVVHNEIPQPRVTLSIDEILGINKRHVWVTETPFVSVCIRQIVWALISLLASQPPR